jgi:hypothetical protein
MVLEATILCIDNSEYVRNSDYYPTRFQVVQILVLIRSHSVSKTFFRLKLTPLIYWQVRRLNIILKIQSVF